MSLPASTQAPQSAESFYVGCLKDELSRRCEKNPRYSVRAFARALGMDAGALSRVLNGSRVPSYKVAERVLKALDLHPSKQREFLLSVADRQKERGMVRMSPALRKIADSGPVTDLSHEIFRVIADWHHYAILELTFMEGFRPDPAWIASQLSISATEAKLAVGRLIQLGLLREERGTLKKTAAYLTTADKSMTGSALKRHQKQVLEAALRSLENDPIEARSMTSMTMTIDPDRLPEAKKRIEKFTRELCAFLEGGKRKRVYEMGLSLFPISKEEKRI